MGYPPVPNEIVLRGWLILKNIEYVLNHHSVGPNIDTSRIYLIGHSRGAEAVLAAWHILNDVPANGPGGADGGLVGFGLADIQSITSLAPTSFTRLAPAVTPDFLMLYGTADGDVNGGLWMVRPFTHVDQHAEYRAAVVLQGGNHNYWNTSWPDDDGIGVGAPRATELEQNNVANAYILAWLRESEGRPYGDVFQRAAQRFRPTGVPANLYSQSRLPSAQRLTIDDYESNFPGNTTSSSGEPVTTSLTLTEIPLRDDNIALETGDENRFFQDNREPPEAVRTHGVVFDWSAPAPPPPGHHISLTIPAPDRDLRQFDAVSMRFAQQPAHALTTGAPGPRVLTVTLIDGTVPTPQTTSVSTEFVTPIAAVYDSTVTIPGLGPVTTTSAVFETIRIPLHRFVVGQPVFDLSDVQAIRLELGAAAGATGTAGTAEGRLGLDDVELER